MPPPKNAVDKQIKTVATILLAAGCYLFKNNNDTAEDAVNRAKNFMKVVDNHFPGWEKQEP